MAISLADYIEVKRKAEKTYYDMYEGQDQENPSVTTRLDRLERVAATNGKLFWAVLGTILAVVGDIISNHIHH